MAKKKKIRASFRKNRSSRARQSDLTKGYRSGDEANQDALRRERISGKGELSRKRTIVTTNEDDGADGPLQLAIDESTCVSGRVLSVHGLVSHVRVADGRVLHCATRRLLKTLNTEQRHVVAAGDRVMVRPAGEREGIIERVEPRYGCLSRTSRGRQHVIVANVDQLLIVMSAAEPSLKPHLIDRMIVSAEYANIRPVICINKVDLIELSDLQPLAGVYGRMGYQVQFVSATTGQGIGSLRELVDHRQSAVVGQSGVGKSSLLNALDERLNLRVRSVSSENEKGRHTTTAAVLLPIVAEGYIVDTPGIRSFTLWDVIPEEVAGYFRDIRPYVARCRFADCTHRHEHDCAVKDAVADNRIDARRYESYCQMHEEV